MSNDLIKDIEDGIDPFINSNAKPNVYLFEVEEMRCVDSDTHHNILIFKRHNDKNKYKYEDQSLNLYVNENKYLNRIYRVVVKANSKEIVYFDRYNSITIEILKNSFRGTYYITQMELKNKRKEDKCDIKFLLYDRIYNYVLPYKVKDLDTEYHKILNDGSEILKFE